MAHDACCANSLTDLEDVGIHGLQYPGCSLGSSSDNETASQSCLNAFSYKVAYPNTLDTYPIDSRPVSSVIAGTPIPKALMYLGR